MSAPFLDPWAPVALLPKLRSLAITDAAHGMPCSLRLPGVCNHLTNTVVWCHLPGIGKGVATKVSDLHGCFGCSSCHDCIDRHAWARFGMTDAYVVDAMLRALAESQSRLVAAGVITVRNQHLL